MQVLGEHNFTQNCCTGKKFVVFDSGIAGLPWVRHTGDGRCVTAVVQQ